MNRDLLTPLWSAPQLPALTLRDWELLLAQARATRLLARLAVLVQARGWQDSVPVPCRPHLESALRVAAHLHAEVLWEADHLQRALHGVAAPVVLLKGAAYVVAGLPPGKGRLFSDVDILVPRDRLDAVEVALFAAGWIPEKLKPYDDRYYRQWMHELPPLQHVQRQTFLDVHHTVTPPTSRFPVDGAALLQCCQPLAAAPGLSVLAPADMVLHSAVHLMQEGNFSGGLRDLLDLNDLLLHFTSQPDFWPQLLRRSNELQLQRPLADVLRQLHRLFGTHPLGNLAAMLTTLSGGHWERLRGRTVSLLLSRALRPAHASCNSASTSFCRWLLYVRSHALRMPWHQILPHLATKAWLRARDRYRAQPATPPAALP